MSPEAQVNLKVIEVPGDTANMRRPIRTVKMLRPRCDVCQPKGLGWWVRCPHDPYHTPAVEQDSRIVAGSRIDPDTGMPQYETVVKERFQRIANVHQVPLSIRISSGMQVERALVLGYKFPQDVDPYPPGWEGEKEFTGYAPMCEFRNCYKSIHKTHYTAVHESLSENKMVPQERYTGRYCSERHAKEMSLKERGVAREVFNPKRRRDQLNEVQVAKVG